MNKPQTNLFGFLGFEESNLLVSLNKCHPDINVMLPKIDGAFQAPLKHIAVSAKDSHKMTVLALYLYIHGQMYFSISTLLRAHVSESLASTRKGIDATLTAYRLLEEPDSLQLYENTDFSFQFIKRYIEKARKKDDSRFSLSEPLLKFHDICSQFGSHADIATFVHRVAVLNTDDPNQAMMTVGMFQPTSSDDEQRRYMVETFLAFAQMIKVFATFIGSVATDFDFNEWQGYIDKLIGACYMEAERLDSEIKAAIKPIKETERQ